MFPTSFFRNFRPALLLAASAGSSSATLLVRESFDNYAGTGSTLTDVAANATGLTGTWTASSANTLTAGGLAFSTYNTSAGNRVAVTYSSGTQLRVQTSLSSTVASGGTLWASYLVSYSNISSGTAALSEVRLNSSASGTGNNAWFRSFGNSNESTGTTFAGIAYDNSLITASGTSSQLTTGVTYMVLSSYTNVGGAGGGTATQWVLTEAQYANFRDAGFDIGNLQARTPGTGAGNVFSLVSDTDSGTKSFASGAYIQMAGNSDIASYDEIRYATTLLDVVAPVPEPSTAALGLLGLTAFFRRRR